MGRRGWAGDPGAAQGSRSCRVVFSFFLHVKLMLLIMREELIRDGTRARIGSFSVLFCYFFLNPNTIVDSAHSQRVQQPLQNKIK